jgi:pyruvate dehydrogenase E2 component (dihydrolipoamide acetyltransferase)
MAYNIIMPKTGMAMEEGTIVRWLKAVGDRVSKGEAIALIETDKVTMDLESDYDGTLLAIVHRDGEVVKAAETIAWIGTPGETVEAAGNAPSRESPQPEAARPASAGTSSASAAPAAGGRVPATPAARAFAASAGVALSSVAGSGPGGAVRLRDLTKAPSVKATPLARKVAGILRVDLAAVGGSGAGGRIRKADVESAAAAPPAGRAVAFTGMRRLIAEKMTRSHHVPAVTLVTRADVTELAVLRERVNAAGGDRLSYTDFIVKAAATALREHPLINSVAEGDAVVMKDEVNVGIAVALEAGLIVPVIRGADRLGVRQIAAAARDLAVRARAGTLSPGEYEGGTFTVTNLGMYGITEFTPIINFPESAILGVGAIEEQLRTGAAGIESRRVMSLCLTHDHRHIDGAPAAAFLARIRALLENCYSLVA